MQLQKAGRMLDGKGHNGTFQPIGQMFSYPFSRSWNETEDGTHYAYPYPYPCPCPYPCPYPYPYPYP